MALITINFYSESIKTNTTINVIVPQTSTVGQIGASGNDSKENLKSLILLHGLSDDETIWLRRTSLERYASSYPIAIIMPSGGRSFYTDMKYGGDYYTYITKEVPQIVKEFLNISPTYENSYIAGLSMGGYGAIKAGLRENNAFSKVFAFSAVIDIEKQLSHDLEINFVDDMINIFGEDLIIPENENLFALVEKKVKNKEKLPELFLACGTYDFFYEDYTNFKNHLNNLNYPFKSFECKEGHTWSFWDEMIKKSLKMIFGEES